MKRGDVILVDFPYSSGMESRVRPALVVQSDQENRQISKTIIAMITGSLRRAGQSTHFLVDPNTPDGAASGLHGPSLVSCINLFTLDQQDVLQTIGQLPAASMKRVDSCLRAALDL